MLVNGQWQAKWDPVQSKDSQGRFIRQSSAFREGIDKETVLAMQSGAYVEPRYQLYVAYICPWATRTLIARSLLGLQKHIGVSVVEPVLSDCGWKFGNFPASTPQEQENIEYIHQLYTQSDLLYTGRATVPVLWDKHEQRIINNESADILRIFNEDLRSVHQSRLDLRPVAVSDEIEKFNTRIYESLNNGVYKSGFASTQSAYEEAYQELFSMLDELELHFTQRTFAVADQLTEADIRLFVTLVRFDIAYYGLFKTNKRMLSEYTSLSAYLKRLLAIPAFSENTNIQHIKAGYYSIKALNPTGIVPAGPALDWFSLLN
jgi:putative glutathione S-transferase